MTNTPDPTAVRKDAAELSESASAWIRENADPEWRDEDYQWWQLQSRVADAYLAISDSSPLTVEVLVGMGGVENPRSELCYRFGRLCVYADGPPEAWEWTYGNDGVRDVPPWLNPRTAGHLAMLLAMMEGR